MIRKKRFPWGASQCAFITATSLLSGLAIAQEAVKQPEEANSAQLDEIVQQQPIEGVVLDDQNTRPN